MIHNVGNFCIYSKIGDGEAKSSLPHACERVPKSKATNHHSELRLVIPLAWDVKGMGQNMSPQNGFLQDTIASKQTCNICDHSHFWCLNWSYLSCGFVWSRVSAKFDDLFDFSIFIFYSCYPLKWFVVIHILKQTRSRLHGWWFQTIWKMCSPILSSRKVGLNTAKLETTDHP